MNHRLFCIAATLVLLHSVQACNSTQYYDNILGLCLNCPSHCLSCSNNYTCNNCIQGYYLNGDGYCSQCSMPNCNSCPNNICAICANGFSMIDQECVSNVNTTLFSYLVGGICLGIILLITCVCYCVKKCRQLDALSQIQNRQREIFPQLQPQSQVEINFVQTWLENNDFKQKKDEICPFCLDAEVNLELACSHLYHIACISKWLMKHSNCPICNRIVTGEAKLFCSSCFSSDIEFNSSLIVSSKFSEKRVCERCKILQKQHNSE